MPKLLSKHGGAVTVFSQFNMRKQQAPGTMSARQAVNVAVNREALFATSKGMPSSSALLPREALGYDPTLTPYAPIPARRDDLWKQAIPMGSC